MKLSSALTGAALMVACAFPALAQNRENALQQLNAPPELLGTDINTRTALNNENPDLAGIEIVNKYPVPKTISFSTSQTFFWTDNAFLLNDSNPDFIRESVGWSGRLAVSLVPYSTRCWTPSVSFEQQWVRYDSASLVDFDAQTVKLNSVYYFTDDRSWAWTAGYSLQRLVSPREGINEFYQQSLLENEISYTRPICPDYNLYFLGAYNIGWRLTNPDAFCRVDNSLLLSLVYMPIEQIRIQPFVRPAVYCYTNDVEFDSNYGTYVQRDRTDFNLSTGIMVSYSPIKEVAISANFNWTGNYSTVGARQYEVMTPGISLTGSIGF